MNTNYTACNNHNCPIKNGMMIGFFAIILFKLINLNK